LRHPRQAFSGEILGAGQSQPIAQGTVAGQHVPIAHDQVIRPPGKDTGKTDDALEVQKVRLAQHKRLCRSHRAWVAVVVAFSGVED
jgi:hypothetical protein